MQKFKPKYKVVILMTSGDVIVDFGVEIIKNIVKFRDTEVSAILICDDGIKPQKDPFLIRFARRVRGRKLFVLVIAYYFLKSKLTGRKCNWIFEPKVMPVNLRQFYNGDIHYLKNLYDQKSIDLIASYQPDLCFHNGHIIIKEPILSLAKDGTIGYHHGDLTMHRGGLPCFWELYNEEKVAGEQYKH